MRYSCNSLGTTALVLGLAIMATGDSARAQMGALPGGWHASRDSAGSYAVGSDVSRRPGGTGFTSGYIRATVVNPAASAALTQEINAAAFRGRRVRLTAYDVRFEAVGNTVALAGSVIGSPADLRSIAEIAANVKRQEVSYRKLSSALVNLDFEGAQRRR